MKIIINSFSYKKGLDCSASSHGGGFVFDCRCLPNPGRWEEFKRKTGQDEAVREFLGSSEPVQIFLNAVKKIVDQAIDNYLERDFSELMISFGCTGGQHRSVYFAESIKGHLLKQKYLQIEINHQVLQSRENYSCEQ